MVKRGLADRIAGIKVFARSSVWYDKLSAPCQLQFLEAYSLFLSGIPDLPTKSHLHRCVGQMMQEDFPTEMHLWPKRDQFCRLIRDKSLFLAEELKRLKKPAKRSPKRSRQ